jgi:ribosomal protein S27AE
MATQWISRRAHRRSLGDGRVITVRASWVLVEQAQEKVGSYRHPCPKCGASIVSVRMSNGGWAHFEGGEGLERIKHPCLHMGEGLSRKRDENTPDFFEAV